MDAPEWPSSLSAGSGGDARQGAVLALCVLGLLVAAFAMPILPATQSDGAGEGDAASTPTPSSGNPSAGNVGNNDESDSLSDGGVIFSGDNPPEKGCIVALEGRRVPGAEMIAHVWKDGYPLENRSVWFNGRYVGDTDSKGRVFTRVPYQRALRVNVSVPSDRSCSVVQSPEFEASDEDRDADGDDDGDAVGVSGASLAGFGAGGAGAGTEAGAPPGETNASDRYNVTGDTDVAVIGDIYPGEIVVLKANVEDVPMRNAIVRVDGERVGRTDARGLYRLRIPADGTRTLAVNVSRGAFAGETTVNVPGLEVNVVPASPLPVLGTPATAEVTLGDRPVRDTAVTIDGERAGATNDEGEYALELTEPWTTVRVRAEGQVAATSLWLAYANTILVVTVGGLLVVGSLRTAFRSGGRRQTGGVALGWLAVALVVAGVLVAGRPGGLAVLALVALVGVGAVIRYRGDEVADRLRWLGRALGALARWVLAQALAWARTLESVVVWARDALVAARNRLASLPRSASALVAQVADWVRRGPRRVRAAFDPRKVAAGGVAVGVVAAATRVAGAAGFLASVGLLTLVGVAVALRRRRPGTDRPTGERTAAASSTDAGQNDESEPSLRERWRTFARWVVPDGWRQRTPGEVSRAAVDRGYPRESVAQLTRVFREVEFGDRPLSTERERAASDAYERLERANRAGDGGDGTNDEREIEGDDS